MRVWFMCLRCLEFRVAGVVSAWGLKIFCGSGPKVSV